ncbi:MAG: hypothetical protein FWF05_04975 [Oscillospiraceae bacterium]|nr:hypothetical protein [Oscillospiraceae bacterium]
MTALKKIVQNKWVCLFWLVFGIGYVTWFGFLKNPFEFTASMIGLDYPWGFKGWGVFSTISIALNTMYMYNRYGYKGRTGRVFLILAAACIFTTINIPSTEILSLQLVAHWSTALLFGVFNSLAMGIILVNMRKKSKKFMVTLYMFIGLLALMIALLIAFNKNGVIENIPMWGAYIILFMANYTSFYDKPEVLSVVNK